MAAPVRKLRVAMIGQGFMGRAHSNAFSQVGKFFDLAIQPECAVLCGRNRAQLDKMAQTWGWQETSTDWRTLIERKDIDVIDIAVPNAMHAAIAIAAGEAGKIVLCEKPLAMSGKEAGLMARAVSGRPNMVWFNYRRIPALAFAKQLIEEGRLGKIFHYRASYLQQWGNDPSRSEAWRFDPDQAGSGASADLLSHVLDTAQWLNGPIDEVSALQQTFMPGRTVDDASLVIVKFRNGSIGTLEATRFAIGYRNRQTMEIHGEKGMLRFDVENFNNLEFLDATEPAHMQGIRNMQVTASGQPYFGNFWPPGHALGYEHTFIAALADFLNALSSGGGFHPDFEDGHRVQLALDAIAESATARGWKAVRSI